MLNGPAPASLRALKNAGMSVGDIDLFELNEAFASVVLEYMRVLKVPHDRINVNGGAIAFGHPLGATGAMLVGTVLDELVGAVERGDRAAKAESLVGEQRARPLEVKGVPGGEKGLDDSERVGGQGETPGVDTVA